jgi:adenosylcobinamide kinase / adenosylcobinamide-phosphate guanylyltransferase
MAARIEVHRARRPASWLTCESATSLSVDRGDAHTLLVEDLTLLLSNLMAEDTQFAEERATREVEHVTSLDLNVILVSNEVGMGLVPPYPLGRAFRDALGRLNQVAAANVNEAYFVVAGVPLRLK